MVYGHTHKISHSFVASTSSAAGLRSCRCCRTLNTSAVCLNTADERFRLGLRLGLGLGLGFDDLYSDLRSSAVDLRCSGRPHRGATTVIDKQAQVNFLKYPIDDACGRYRPDQLCSVRYSAPTTATSIQCVTMFPIRQSNTPSFRLMPDLALSLIRKIT